MNKINIHTSQNSYSITIGSSIFQKFKDFIPQNLLSKKALIVVDRNVHKYHKSILESVLTEVYPQNEFLVLTATENTKSLETTKRIYKSLKQKNLGRDSVLISIGGGVIGDVAGFAASTFMRGIQIIHIPTTLLADADSAIGGKTGVNFSDVKNIIGTFYQPSHVLIDTDFLSTLPKKELKSGIGEIVKYALLSDKDFFEFVLKNIDSIPNLDKKIIGEIINRCILFKAAVVENDEREKDLRKILNLGHTFAHAFESALKFKITHGEAVIAGIISSIFLSERLGIIDEKKRVHLLQLPTKVDISEKILSINPSEVIAFMYLDKKAQAGEIRFVLPSDIGKTLINVIAGKEEIAHAVLSLKGALKKSWD
ncbi:MAG: 3-dehydroquinate synthase [Ignavibacteriaceae bacterium]|nr:3-dehydroquinate synthase [Ignavibacteriaceae bacterium]